MTERVEAEYREIAQRPRGGRATARCSGGARWRGCAASSAELPRANTSPPAGGAARNAVEALAKVADRGGGVIWATRRHVHIDRTACAWLIRRFVDDDAEFVFVDDPDDVPAEATPV